MLSNAERPLRAYPADQHSTAEMKVVSANQVEQMLAALTGTPDAALARQLYSLEPSTRFDSASMQRCQALLAGPKSKQAFAALAAWSKFYDPPPGAAPALALPDVAAQKQMLMRSAEYVATTLRHLPNFSATRTTTTFTRKLRSGHFRPFGKYEAKVYYRDGDELVRKGRFSRIEGLTTRGEFGPILATAMLDAAKGNLTWDRWEQEPSGVAAVFAYAVTAIDSHYKVDGQRTAYRGEIAVDPANGAILRLTLRSGMDPALGVFFSGGLLMVADIEVDYGPVEIGGKSYICPLTGVALSEGAGAMWLNEVVFENYHLFRGDTRILTGFQSMDE